MKGLCTYAQLKLLTLKIKYSITCIQRPLKGSKESCHVKKIVGGFGKKVVLVLV